MVHGETYYRKFQTTPSIDLNGYSGTWKLLHNGLELSQFSGSMTKGLDYFEVSFNSSTLDTGLYILNCFVTFPDGFIQAINSERIQITI